MEISKIAYNLSIKAKISIDRAISIEERAKNNISLIKLGAKFGERDIQEWMCESYHPFEVVSIDEENYEMVVIEPGNFGNSGPKKLNICDVVSLVIDK